MLALLSVSDKRGLVPFAQGLSRLGFSLLSTGGTHKALGNAGLSPKTVSEHTGSPEILGGRVKTLHPKIHGGILARLDEAGDEEALERHGIAPIDLVVVNLYPFAQTVAKGAELAEATEQIDIGGPTMVRAAAKNAARVGVVVDPDDYPAVLAELEGGEGLSSATRRRLMRKAFEHTAAYDATIAAYLQGLEGDDPPETLTPTFVRAEALRYGENPHQRAAYYRAPMRPRGPSVAFSSVLQGKALSYNNLLDLDAALSVVLSFEARPCAVVIKHNTPCGVAEGETLVEAYRRARAVDEVSAFGGIVALNRPVDQETAEALAETFLEAVIAPAFEPAAREVLSAKKNLRLLETGPQEAGDTGRSWELRTVSGGLLLQERDDFAPATEWKVATRRQPTDEEWEALRFAWRVVRHVKSNAIAFARADRLIAAGGGQTSRVDAVRIAAARGGEALVGSACASDAFFPFRDGVDEIARAGARCIIQPGGSVRDEEVIAAADEHGLAMVMTAVRHFRH